MSKIIEVKEEKQEEANKFVADKFVKVIGVMDLGVTLVFKSDLSDADKKSVCLFMTPLLNGLPNTNASDFSAHRGQPRYLTYLRHDNDIICVETLTKRVQKNVDELRASLTGPRGRRTVKGLNNIRHLILTCQPSG